MPLDELFIREHRDQMFGDGEETCTGCGRPLPADEDAGLVIEDDRSNGGPLRLFCSDQCASNYDPGTEDDLYLDDDPEAIAFQSVIDAQEDDPRDLDMEDYYDMIRDD